MGTKGHRYLMDGEDDDAAADNVSIFRHLRILMLTLDLQSFTHLYIFSTFYYFENITSNNFPLRKIIYKKVL